MTYTDILLLPDSVRNSLDEDAQKVWMKSFNSELVKSHNLQRAKFIAYQSVKEHPSCRHFEGIISSERLDKQGDVMTLDATFQALDKLVNRGGFGMDLHKNLPVSFVYQVEKRAYDGKEVIYGYGVLYRGEAYYDYVWELIKSGQRNAFSIGGFALKFHDECDAKSCYRRIDEVAANEITHCPEGANPDAKLVDFNRLAKTCSVCGEEVEDFEEQEGVEEIAKPDKLEDCVGDVMAQGYDESSAHAICNSSLNKYYRWAVKKHSEMLLAKCSRR